MAPNQLLYEESESVGTWKAGVEAWILDTCSLILGMKMGPSPVDIGPMLPEILRENYIIGIVLKFIHIKYPLIFN